MAGDSALDLDLVQGSAGRKTDFLAEGAHVGLHSPDVAVIG